MDAVASVKRKAKERPSDPSLSISVVISILKGYSKRNNYVNEWCANKVSWTHEYLINAIVIVIP